MAWSDAFIAALSRPSRGPVILRVATFDPVVGSTPGRAAQWSPSRLVSGSLAVDGPLVEPITWRSQIGGFSFTLAVEDLRQLLLDMRRGTLVQVTASFPGLPDADTAVVEIGQVRGIRSRGGGPGLWLVDVTCASAVGGFGSRYSADDPARLPLFQDVPGTNTTIDTFTWFAGTSTTMYLADATGFQKDSGPGRYGMVYCEPSGGDPFYLRYASISGNQLTTETTGALGTTASDMVAGDKVSHVAYVGDHPLAIVAKVITSTGGGSNGDYDTLPERWGFALPERFLDTTDIESHIARVQISGGDYELDLMSNTVQHTPFEWLTGAIAPAGFFVTQRQGAITARSVQDPWGGRGRVAVDITDADILLERGRPAVTLEHFDPGQAAQYAGYVVTGPTGSDSSTVSAVATLPAVRQRTYDLSSVLFRQEASIRAEVAGRHAPWARQVPERLRMRAAGLRLAQLAPGDHTTISSRLLTGRAEASGAVASAVFAGRPLMVARVAPDWRAGVVDLDLVLPLPDQLS